MAGQKATVYTCPDCGGVLWQDGAGRQVAFHCHVGHAYAPEILLSQKSRSSNPRYGPVCGC